MKKDEGVSFVEARVEASKRSKGGKTVSIIERDGDFFLRDGTVADPYQVYHDGSKVEQPKEPKKVEVPIKKEVSPKQSVKELAIAKAKQPKPPTISSLPAKVNRKKVSDEKIEATEKKVMAKVEAQNKEKAKPKRYSTPDEEEEIVVTKKSKNQKQEIMKTKKAEPKKSNSANQPPSVVVDFIKEKTRTLIECAKFLMKQGGRSEGTVKIQVGRLKNHPNLVINGEQVKFKK